MELNKQQRRILELLSINCRFTNKDIGKIIGISDDAVDYQIDKLINKEKLASFSVQFDYRFLGYAHYHVLIRLKNPEENLEEIKKIDSITSINSSYGKFDLQLIVISKNKEELNEILRELELKLDIKNIEIAEFNSFYKRFTNVIPPINLGTKIPDKKGNVIYQLNKKHFADVDKIPKIELDKIDKKIIRGLIKNPRAKYTEISKKTGLNHETIRYRINNYVKTRFIKNFGLLHDFKKHGLYTNYLLLRSTGDENKLVEHLNKNQNIFYSAKLIGSYNTIVYLTAKDPSEFGAHIREIRKTIGDGLIESDLLFLEDVQKFVQFPMKELGS